MILRGNHDSLEGGHAMSAIPVLDRGFDAAQREYLQSGACSVPLLRRRLQGQQNAAFCAGYLGFFLKAKLISGLQFKNVMEWIAPRGPQQMDWSPANVPSSWQRWLKAKPFASNRSISRRQRNQGSRRPPTPPKQRDRKPLDQGRGWVDCPEGHIVIDSLARCPLCDWCVRPELQAAQVQAVRERGT